MQYEQTQDSLESKRETLEELEKNEAEARRLQEALAAAGVPSTLSRSRSNGALTVGGGRNDSSSTSPNSADGRRDLSRSEPLSPGAPSSGGVSPGFSSPERLDAGSDDEENGFAERQQPQLRIHVPEPLPPAPVSTSSRRGKSIGSGFISALSHSIHGIMDVDPEAARRSNISKTKDAISQVREASST